MTKRPTITLTRGIPASGKSTWAKSWVQEDPERRVRVNRDDLRKMLYGAKETRLDWAQEQNVSAVEMAIARTALEKGKDVVMDAMHLRAQYIKRWFTLGYPVEFKDFWVELEDALARNELRGSPLPGDVIEKIYQRFCSAGVLPVPPKPENVEGEKYKPGGIPAYSFDIDGTLALMGDRRSPYDPTKYHLDEPNPPVVETLRSLTDSMWWHHGSEDRGRTWAIIGLSGRSEDHREATEKWLKDHDIVLDALFMRKSGDNRNDGIVKAELVRDNISGVYDVIAHFDDRQRVVDSLRHIGLPVFQVAPGNF